MTDRPGYYAHLDFNAPLSDARAAALIRFVTTPTPRTVLDVGCGWAELLLRVLAAVPDSVGVGVDVDAQLIERGRRNATIRGLAERALLVEGDASALEEHADLVLCIGSDHVFGSQGAALHALHDLVLPGGRLLVGSGFWSKRPALEQIASLGATRNEMQDLAGLVELAIEAGFRPLAIHTANSDEWDAFESGYLADPEHWLLEHADSADAIEIRAAADKHRVEWLRGYRDVLGFAYLVLGRRA